MHSLSKRPFGKAQLGPQDRETPAVEPIPLYDRREHPRKHVLQRGKLAFGSIDFAVDCLIHDISVGGARVRVETGSTIPESVILVHLRDRVAYEASVVWRKNDGTLGLKFEARHDLAAAKSPGLRSLRQHCVEYSLR
jgi:hypothetical protein